MNVNTRVLIEAEVTVKAFLPPGMTFEEAEAKLIVAGNTIVRRETDGIVICQAKAPALTAIQET